ncbi:hypothetical protein [Persephonella sp.]
MDRDIKEAYTYYFGRVKSACGNIYKEKISQIKEKFKFIKDYTNWYKVTTDGKSERIQLQ